MTAGLRAGLARVDWRNLACVFFGCVFLTVAGLAGGLLTAMILLGMTGMDLEFYLALLVITGLAIMLAFLVLRPAEPHELAELPQRTPSSSEPFERLLADDYRVLLNEALEKDLALPAHQPPHEHRIRPGWPPGAPETET